MSKLKCDFAEFNSTVNKISELIESYSELLSIISSQSNDSYLLWQSEAQRIYCNKFMERKTELETLANNLNDIKSYLTEVVSTYQEIEGKYS